MEKTNMFRYFTISLCVLINIPQTLQFSYIISTKNVDTSMLPEQHFRNYLDKLHDVNGIDRSNFKLSNAFYIKDTVYSVTETLLSHTMVSIEDDNTIVEENISIHLVTGQFHDIYCERSNVTENLWHVGRIRTTNKIEIGTDDPFFASNNTETVEGNGTDVYILDTGVRRSHVSFGGRVSWEFVASEAWNTDKTADDLNGHGTHVAGIIGADTYGIARSAAIISVKVLDRSGGSVLSDLVEGIAFAVEHAVNKSVQTGAVIKAICNLSLGFAGSSPLLEGAIKLASLRGLIFVVAAGNDDAGSCSFSPGSIHETITVAASDVDDKFYGNSNFGSCVDIIAPGVNILSAGISSDTSNNVMTGTSMATPMVAGGLAIYMSRYQGDKINHSMAMDWLTSTATKNAVDIPPNIEVTTVNHLMFIACTAEGEEITSPSSPLITIAGATLQSWEITLIVIGVILAVAIPIVSVVIFKNTQKVKNET